MVAPIATSHASLPDELPSEDWSTDQLGQYAAAQIRQTDSIEASLPNLIRKSVVSYYRAGQALYFARKRLKADGEWCAWQDTHGLPRNSMLTYIQLYERAVADGGERAISGMTLQQAKEHYGIGKAKTADEKAKVSDAKAKAKKPRSPLGTIKGNPADPLALAQMALATLEASAAAVAAGVARTRELGDEWVSVLGQIEKKAHEMVEMVGAKTRPELAIRGTSTDTRVPEVRTAGSQHVPAA